MTAWTKFVTKLFHERSKQNPEYKFKNALKDAAKLYKKGGEGEEKSEEPISSEEPKATPSEEPEVTPSDEPMTQPESAPMPSMDETAPVSEPAPISGPTDDMASCGMGGKRIHSARRNKKGGKNKSRKMKKGGKKSLRKSKASRASKKRA